MQDNYKINDELKKMIVSDEFLTQQFIVYLLYSIYKEDYPKDYDKINLNDYEAFNKILYSKKDLRKPLIDTLKEEQLSNNMINWVVKYYEDLALNEAKTLIYSLSHLLYIQDKYKDTTIGQEIDKKIKLWLDYIKHYDEQATNEIINQRPITDYVEYKTALDKLGARVLYLITPHYNLKINASKDKHLFMDLWNFTITSPEDLKGFFKSVITNNIDDSNTYKRYSDKIDYFISKLEKDNNIISNKDDLTNSDTKIWREKADKYISHILEYKTDKDTINLFSMDYMLNHLAYNDYQLKTYKLNLDYEIQVLKIPQEKEKIKDNKILQATSRQLKAIDNARGGLVTYTETNTQAIKNEINEKEHLLKTTHIKADKDRFKKDLEQLKKDLVIAQEKEKELKDEYNRITDYLNNIYKSMDGTPKTSSYYKDLKKQKKDTEKRKKEIERILNINGWQLDYFGNGNYELILNERKKESLKLTIENLSKQIAKYTKEEQDIFDFLINKYLHNTNIKQIKFTLREYENVKNRVKPTNYLVGDIQAIRLLFREVWTYYITDDKTFTFNEEHLFTRLTIKGELETEFNNLDNANLDTEISLEPTETLQRLLQDHDNYLYMRVPMEIMQLNNDKEYLAKRLLKYFNYLARIKHKSIIEISLNKVIEELQHYGLKQFNMLDRHKTYKTEIVDVIDKAIKVLEGNNRAKKVFIEMLDLEPFYTYDELFKGKSQETIKNEWGKQKIKLKVLDLDDKKLIETKNKSQKKKNKATKK